MSPESKAKEHRCEKCGKVYATLMRLQHHQAAEHAPKTLADIPTSRDVRHRPKNMP